ncbi:cytochrome P450, partial [Agrocybe pediades]
MSALDNVSLVVLGLFIFLVCVYWRQSRTKSLYSHLPLPPSRKGYPILGNLLEMPTKFEWIKFHEWSKELNTDILCVTMFGTTLIVLDTSEAATELLERRSSKYSGRPRMPMVNELMGWDFNFGLMQYGSRCEAIIAITYGLDVQPKDDPYIAVAEEGVVPLALAIVPGAFLVDTIPLLKYVPAWMPGAGFKKKAREWTELSRRMVEEPFEATKKLMAQGVCSSSFVSDTLVKMQDVADRDDAYREDNIQGVAGAMYAAGTDTTSSIVASCILALLDKPEILKKAQMQLDSVLKPGHLPDFDDEASLPYITAIAKEGLRWRDVVPT